MNNNIEEVSNTNIMEIFGGGIPLFPDTEEKLLKIKEIVNSENQKIFVYKMDDKYIGFIHISIGNDYKEINGPVGYLEGLFAHWDYNEKDIKKELLNKGEEWVKKMGCTNFLT